MVNLHANAPAVGHVQHRQGGPSIIWDTIIATVASVFSLVMASSVERESPELAAALRFVPAAAGLIWIVRRCLGGPQQQHGHYQQPVPVAPVQRGWRWIPQFNGYNPGNWWNNPAPQQHVYHHHQPHHVPAPQPNPYFPPAQHAPAQPPAVLHVAPQTRNNFPAAQRAPANPVNLPPPVQHYHAPQPQLYAAPKPPFPAAQKTPANPVNLPPPVQHRHAPQPQLHAAPQPLPFPAAQRAPAQSPAFPSVNRAPAQGGNMHAAPVSRMVQAPATRS